MNSPASVATCFIFGCFFLFRFDYRHQLQRAGNDYKEGRYPTVATGQIGDRDLDPVTRLGSSDRVELDAGYRPGYNFVLGARPGAYIEAHAACVDGNDDLFEDFLSRRVRQELLYRQRVRV